MIFPSIVLLLTLGLEPPGCPEVRFGHVARGEPAPDLHCLELLPGPAAQGLDLGGVVRLLPGVSPFTVQVDRNGVVQTRFEIAIHGLPDPGTFGADRYVLWITPPTLDRFERLGEVTNGVTRTRAAGFNQYLLWVSAEADSAGDEPSNDAPQGPLVLRGTSPSMVLRPHDLPFLVAEMAGEAMAGAAAHDGHGAHSGDRQDAGPGAHAAHAAHSGHASPEAHAAHAESGMHAPPPADGLAPAPWAPPPMHPAVVMPHGMMALRPSGEGVFPVFPTDLPEARAPERIRLADGDTLRLEAGPVLRRVGHLRVPGFGYNGQIPGPILEAAEGSRIHVDFANRTSLPTAVHWHGLRLENAYDGVPGVTQPPIEAGGRFHYRIDLPDEGTFWYHPHLHEVIAKDLGLAGTIQVLPRGDEPASSGSPGVRTPPLYAPVDREINLVLDDHLVGPEGPVPYGRTAPTHALMGRFGNVLLVNGETDWQLEVRPGEVLRLHLSNVASTRTFNVTVGDLPLKLVAGDIGKVPEEHWVESVILGPAERWVVDVRIPEGHPHPEIPLENRVQAMDHMGARFIPVVHALGALRITGEALAPDRPEAVAYPELRVVESLEGSIRERVAAHLERAPDYTLELTLRTDGLPFPLDPLLRWEGAWRPPIEWEGTMPEMDWVATGQAVEWVLRDPATGLENMAIDWRFRQGEQVVVRLINDRDSLHPMQHPIHVHGQRMLVLRVNGEPHPAPTWKDTVIVPVGQMVDVLVDMSNPGTWMIHCHIAEHMETGMMALFTVEGAPGLGSPSARSTPTLAPTYPPIPTP
jgi:suppressor of ftsI